MNMQKIMQEAQKAQAKIQKAQADLEASEFSKETQGIEVTSNGAKVIQKITIDQDLMDDKEMLEDMLVVAINEVFKEVDTKTEELMSKAAGNLNLPF